MAPEHAKALVWSDSVDTTPDEEEDDNDRMFTFEVAKTHEQEESVKPREGFGIVSRAIAYPEAPPEELAIDPAVMKPRLLAGEVVQAFMTVKYMPPSTKLEAFTNRSLNQTQLRSVM